MGIRQTALEIILKANSWETFVDELARFGSNPEFKKLKGEAFEQLTKFYLELNPIFKSMFSEIWHHSEIPINVLDNLKLPSPEIGVDLVAQQIDGNFCAIQCKFHQDKTQNVSYDELSTFFSVTERKETYEKLSHRLVCTSANEVTKKVSKLHPEKLGFICSNDFQELDEIEFRKIHHLIDGKPQKLRPFTPRAHQIQAIRKGREYFVGQHKNRGKIIHPCGSGKSLTAYWLARELMSQTVLVAVPSLALVKQTLNAWAREALADETSMEWMAVCSDQDVSSNDDPAFKTYDLGIAVTTDPTKVSKFLQQPSKSLKVIITTYQSSNVISDAVKEAKHQFDLGIFDEAHKTAGHKSKKFSQLLDDDNVPIHKKVFMTATERQFRGNTTDFLSMDDQLAYGEIIDQLSFREALEQDPPILCDYKVITVTVLRSEIERIISGNKFTKINGRKYSFEEDASTIAALISLRKLANEKSIKHAISFHSSIKRAEDFRNLNNEINLKTTVFDKLSGFHVSGKNSTGERHAEINRFLHNSPSVITNARCLTEGVDIPAVDAVIFSDPKQSVIDIVQAAGRAMRTHENKDLGYIIIPVILDGAGEDLVNDAFKQLVTVIAALGINDERIIEEAKQYVSSATKTDGKILEFVEYYPTDEIDFNDLIDGLQIKIWDRLSFAKSVIGESEFVTWMRQHTTLSDKTRKNYSGAVRKISNDLVKLDLAFSSLEEISEHANLKELKEKYFAIDEFKELDIRGKGMYSAGFNRLIEYQRFLHS